MKTKLLLSIFVFFILFPTSDIFAPPSPNEWPKAPYCPGGCPLDYLKQRWAEYYDYKGPEWMETKKQEMLFSIKNETLYEWLNKDPTLAHYNVHNYYFYKGEVPNLEGKYIYQVSQETVWSDVENNIKNNQFPLGEHTYINFTLLLLLVGGGFVGIVFGIKRIKK
jgi:hypothetical protein